MQDPQRQEMEKVLTNTGCGLYLGMLFFLGVPATLFLGLPGLFITVGLVWILFSIEVFIKGLVAGAYITALIKQWKAKRQLRAQNPPTIPQTPQVSLPPQQEERPQKPKVDIIPTLGAIERKKKK
jgi:hypothetical protein